jgi:hypothetical protein
MLAMNRRYQIISSLSAVVQSAFALMLVLQVACDSGSDSNQNGEPDIATAEVVDTTAPVDLQTAEVVVAYAPEPYGTVAEATIADFGFYDPTTEETVYLHQWYQDPKVKLLMIISTAAW